MPTSSLFPPGLALATRVTLRAAGVSNQRVRSAVRSGRWQEPVRGIVVPHAGPLTQRERWLIALAFAGPVSALSHHSALLCRGARISEPPAEPRVSGVRGDYDPPQEGGLVQVTRAHGQHMASHGFVVVHQSRRPLDVQEVQTLRVTSAARAVVDVAVTATRRRDVDHVVSDALQRGLCTVSELCEQAVLLGRRRTGWLDQALRDAGRGMRSVGEADLRRVVLAAELPEPEWGAKVSTPVGDFFVDAPWRSRGVVAEADGRAWHLGAQEWAADLVRQNALMSTGLRLVRFPVSRMRAERAACGVELARVVLGGVDSSA